MKKSIPFSVTAAELLPAPDTSFLFHSGRTWIMGVLNATPDSFYPGSRVSSLEQTHTLAERMVDEGADVLDIGGESSRPGAAEVGEDEELARVLPLVESLRSRLPHVPLSIDSQKANVAEKCLALGVSVINDISALRTDPQMADVVAQAQSPVVLMHMQGTPLTMQKLPHYTNVIDDVKRFFEERLAYAVRKNILEKNIILDPGIGFGKTFAHNMDLLKNLSSFLSFGRPLLVGVSRKSFIGRMLGSENSPLPVEQRLEGSLAAGLWAVKEGAGGLRVHDVRPTRQALGLWEGLATS